MQRAQCMLLFLVLAVIPPGFEFYVVTRSYSSRPFLCTLAISNGVVLFAILCFVHLLLVYKPIMIIIVVIIIIIIIITTTTTATTKPIIMMVIVMKVAPFHIKVSSYFLLMCHGEMSDGAWVLSEAAATYSTAVLSTQLWLSALEQLR